MMKSERLIPNGENAPWDLSVPTTLRSPKNLEPMLEGIKRQQALLQGIALAKQSVFSASADQIKAAAEHLQKTVAPLLEWAKKPRVRSELFMYRRSITGDKFSKLVSTPIETLLVNLELILDFVTPTWSTDSSNRRAQIMSIRGLALSCAPNFTRKGDVKSTSRPTFGMRNSLVA